jgi:hypothetical protein
LGKLPKENRRPRHELAIPEALFEHQTVLYSREGQPISEVHEIYQRGVLAFPPPKP